MLNPIQILIVDDQAIARKILSIAVEPFADSNFVETAPNGNIALNKAKLKAPDLILLDINMPDMNGIEVLKKIKQQVPKAVVVMISSENDKDASITLEALSLGAFEFVAKPQGNSLNQSIEILRSQLKPIVSHIRSKQRFSAPKQESFHSTHTSSFSKAKSTTPQEKPTFNSTSAKKAPHSNFSVIAIGVSTGGPEVLNKVIPKLSEKIPVPILLVQHMPPHFTKSLAESLNTKSKLTVVESENGMSPQAGTVYIAAGGTHMTVVKKGGIVTIEHNSNPPENSCRPAVDVLFRSIANVYSHTNILTAILTGMGSDGTKGVAELKKKNCFCITQEAKSCTVYGMPRSVDEAGLSDISLNPEELILKIHSFFKL